MESLVVTTFAALSLAAFGLQKFLSDCAKEKKCENETENESKVESEKKLVTLQRTFFSAYFLALLGIKSIQLQLIMVYLRIIDQLQGIGYKVPMSTASTVNMASPKAKSLFYFSPDSLRVRPSARQPDPWPTNSVDGGSLWSSAWFTACAASSNWPTTFGFCSWAAFWAAFPRRSSSASSRVGTLNNTSAWKSWTRL